MSEIQGPEPFEPSPSEGGFDSVPPGSEPPLPKTRVLPVMLAIAAVPLYWLPYQLPRFTPWDQDAWRWMLRLLRMRVAGAGRVEAA